jgi:two-component system response regulator FixJ
MPVTVFVVDDDPAMRSGLDWLFTSVGYATELCPSGHEFLRKYSAERRGCIVLDVRMPGMSGLELQAELQSRGIDLPVIIMTGYPEVPVAVRALKAGAFDFLEKPFSDQHLLDVVERAIKCDEARQSVRMAQAEVERRMACLTNREREILGWVVEGKSSKEIALELQLSQRTVEVHRERLMATMGVSRVAELVRTLTATRIARAGTELREGDKAPFARALRAELKSWLPEHDEQSVSRPKG